MAREHGLTLAAATFGVSHKAIKSLLWRAEHPLPARPPWRAPPSLSGLSAEEILDRLLERSERLVVVTAEAEGLGAKVAALKRDLISEREAKMRLEAERKRLLHERLARAVAEPGDQGTPSAIFAPQRPTLTPQS